MGKLIRKVPKQQYHYETDWSLVGRVFFSALGFVVVAMVSIGIAVHLTRALLRHPGPPPKVITKVVHESAQSAAQREYITQCEENTKSDGNGGNNHGVPNVQVNPYTCTFAN